VFDGFVLQKPALEHLGIGGDLLDTVLDELLKKKRVNVVPFYKRTEGMSPKYLAASRLAVVKDLKHELCRMSASSLSTVPGYANWHINIPPVDHPSSSMLPDGTPVDLGPFHQVIPELLFDPVPVQAIPILANSVQSFRGLGVSVLETVANCDVDARKAVSSDIILTGGSSLFANMPDRLLKFVTSPDAAKTSNSSSGAPLVPLVKSKVTAAPVSVDRISSSWLGCSIIASCATFQQLWISKRQYAEDGLDRIAAKQLFW
jgi:actin-related protein